MITNDIHKAHFSKHLYWDIQEKDLPVTGNERFYVKRVLEVGLYSDWQLIVSMLGMEEIVVHAKAIRHMDSKTLNFISTVSQTPKEEFRCYTTQQSTNKHWIY